MILVPRRRRSIAPGFLDQEKIIEQHEFCAVEQGPDQVGQTRVENEGSKTLDRVPRAGTKRERSFVTVAMNNIHVRARASDRISNAGFNRGQPGIIKRSTKAHDSVTVQCLRGLRRHGVGGIKSE